MKHLKLKNMKNIFLSIVLLAFSAFGQTEKEAYKNIASQFEELYNAGDYQNIFELFDDNMKSNLPLDKTKSFLGGLKAQVGEIKSRKFTGYVKGTFASYKTEFENALFALNISVDKDNKINGLLIQPFQEQTNQSIQRNKTNLILPFDGEWFVFWGGDTKDLNYHVESKAQKGAFDFVVHDDKGKSYKSNGLENEDYYAYGEEIISPCNAKVVQVVDGIPDNTPGDMNPVYIPGNTVILKTDQEEYLFLAHFRKHSIVVEEGQDVKQGELLGLCGNSGNSSEPHLHFHIQNQKLMHKATGIKAFFNNLMVDGKKEKTYSPIKGEIIKNLKQY
jgi:murein DD-endopeptidase MepM/ murein hydrolase activator NlpD